MKGQPGNSNEVIAASGVFDDRIYGDPLWTSGLEKRWLAPINLAIKTREGIAAMRDTLVGMEMHEMIRFCLGTDRADAAYEEQFPEEICDQFKAESLEAVNFAYDVGCAEIAVCLGGLDEVRVKALRIPYFDVAIIFVNIPIYDYERDNGRCLPSQSQP
jgi:hypothetical protein